MGIQVVSGASSDVLTIDPTSKAARTTLYGADGVELTKIDHTTTGSGITAGTTRGIPVIGADYKTPVLLRSTGDGSLITGDRNLYLYDSCEGAAVDTNKWIQTVATMTITQATGVITFNANSTVTTTTGAMHLSHRFFPFISRTSLVFRCRARATANFNNNLIELGFGSPASSTSASIVNGACWRKDGTGQWVPVITIASGADITGTPISNATFTGQIATTDYAIFEVVLNNDRVMFSIYKTTGELVFFQNIDVTVSSAAFSQTHLQALVRTYNSAGTGTAVQLFVDEISVWASDFQMNKPYAEALAGMGYGGIVTSPTAYTQLETYANNAAPSTATPSNTAAAIGTLGGLAAWNNAGTSFGASDTLDLIIFGAAVPSPYGMMIKGLRIDSVSLGAANGAAVYTIQWFLAVNSSALSLATGAPYAPMKKALGFQTIASTAAIGTQFSPVIDVRFGAGIYVFPGRFVVVGARVIGASAATASQVIRTACSIDGYFE